MKYLPSILLFGLSAFCLHAETPAPAPKPAGDPFVKTPGAAPNAKKADLRNCFVVYEVYALDKNDALAVIEGQTGGAAQYQRTLELAKTGKARLETLTSLTAANGQRVESEAIDEVRYPTEFAAPADEKSPAAPTAWETRNAGDNLVLECNPASDGAMEINLAPGRVTLRGFRDISGLTGEAPALQPIFETQGLTTSTTLAAGEPLLLGTFTPPPVQPNEKQADEVWLAFLRADVQAPKPAESKPASRPGGGGVVRLEYSVYSLDRALARDLLAAPVAIGAPWERLQPLLADKKARFEHLSIVTTTSGQRALAEETREERYWTEMHGESLAATSTESTSRTTLTGPTDQVREGGPGKKDPSKNTTTTETTTVTHTDAKSPRIPAYADAFETRNAGFMAEVEPVLEDDHRDVSLNEVVSQTTLLGNLNGTGVAAKYPWQPVFETRKLTNSLTVPVGEHVLAGTLNPPGADGVNGRTDAGRTWLLFVRAVVEER